MESLIRLQKFLSQAGIASRRKAENLITDGQIKINGEVVTKLGTMVDPTTDVIEYQDKQIGSAEEKIYIALCFSSHVL